ncbi:hypothetical protein RQM80_24880 [Citrobacter freundii]|nr:hypothetical protein [Citrobacter freundii]
MAQQQNAGAAAVAGDRRRILRWPLRPCLWSRSGALSVQCASTAPDGGNGSAAERWRGGGG